METLKAVSQWECQRQTSWMQQVLCGSRPPRPTLASGFVSEVAPPEKIVREFEGARILPEKKLPATSTFLPGLPLLCGGKAWFWFSSLLSQEACQWHFPGCLNDMGLNADPQR